MMKKFPFIGFLSLSRAVDIRIFQHMNRKKYNANALTLITEDTEQNLLFLLEIKTRWDIRDIGVFVS